MLSISYHGVRRTSQFEKAYLELLIREDYKTFEDKEAMVDLLQR
jgi:hypothetical protein